MDEQREAEWADRIRAHRAEKERTFGSDTETPLGEEAFAAFDGLAFFELDLAFRLTGRLEPLAEVRDVSLPATRGPPLTFEHVGNVGIKFDGTLTVLQVFRAPAVDTLLLPFRDRTNGNATWEGGRYLNISAPDSLEAGEEPETQRPVDVTVDFNLAYHPLCVYDEQVRSAKPPTENELQTPVRAGERL
jgi:hypothetical protein